MICKNTDQKKFLITASLAILVFYFPLIILNDYYRDDYFRVSSNVPGWIDLGRPFADLLAFFLSANWQFLPDSSPFFLIVSLLIVIASTCYTLSIRKIPYTATTAVLLIGFLFNPFMLAAFLYRFDCLIMAAGIAFSLIAWGYYPKSKALSGLFCFISMGFYQSYINIFIVLIIIESSYYLYNGKNIKYIIQFIIKALFFVFLITLLYYFFSKLFIHDYAQSKSVPIFMGDKTTWHYLAVILENVYSRYFGFLSPTGKIIYILAICISLVEIQLHFYKDTLYSHKIVRAAITSFILIFMLPLSVGVLFGIVGNGHISPRLMVQSIFFSVVIIFLTSRFLTRLQKTCLVSNLNEIAKTKLTWIVIAYLLLCPLVFSYIVNNAIRIQNVRDRYIIEQIATSLEQYPSDKPTYVLGKFGNSPFLHKTIENMRLIAHLVPNLADWTLWLRLKEYSHDNLIWKGNRKDLEKIVKNICLRDIKPDITRKFYSIYNLGNELFLWVGQNDLCTSEYNNKSQNDVN